MCPYYHEGYNMCLLYKSTPTDYHQRAYCKEYEKNHTQCPNYEQCKRSFGGQVPPPSHYR